MKVGLWDPHVVVDGGREVVKVTVGLDGVYCILLISREALEDHFRGKELGLVAAYQANRELISQRAYHRYKGGGQTEIHLGTADF